jgi:hypothetical protein
VILRLACSGAGTGPPSKWAKYIRIALDKAHAPDVRLAHTPGAQGDNILRGKNGVERMPGPSVRLAEAGSRGRETWPQMETLPALLVSYVYLAGFEEYRHDYAFRDWALDSGAFSAHNSGKVIELQAYIDCAKRLMDSDSQLVEVFGLDVIGDHEAGLRNCDEMRRQGLPVIPTYHFGEPEHVLSTIAAEYPKIALGGVARRRGGVKLEWAEQCFARVWPKKIHGFGYGGEKAVMSLPWHSVDATNWELGPCAFGNWNSFGRMSVRGSHQNLRAEVEWYLRLEKRARQRWAKEMAMLEAQT